MLSRLDYNILMRPVRQSIFCYCYLAACVRWTSQPNTLYHTDYPDRASTLEDCKAVCVNIPQCNGVNWDYNRSTKHNIRCGLTGPWSRKRYKWHGTTHHDLNRNCQGNNKANLLNYISSYIYANFTTIFIGESWR